MKIIAKIENGLLTSTIVNEGRIQEAINCHTCDELAKKAWRNLQSQLRSEKEKREYQAAKKLDITCRRTGGLFNTFLEKTRSSMLISAIDTVV